MSPAIRKRTGGAERQTKTGKKRGRKPSREGQAAAAQSVEVIRKGTPGRIQARLAEREQRGEIVVRPDENDLSADDFLDEEQLDCEIELGDEDQEPIEELDGQGQGEVDVSVHPAELLSIDTGEERTAQFEIRVSRSPDGKWRCDFPRPAWMRGASDSDDADNDFNQITVRFALFDALSDWLTEKRQDFLDRPEPLALAIEALDEMHAGCPSVVPSEFLRRSGIGDILVEAGSNTEKAGGDASLLSRLSSETEIVWPDGRMPLDFLFCHEARVAWVASSVRQFIERDLKKTFDPQLLPAEEPRIPKDKAERERLSAMQTSSLTLPEFITRCCQMAGKISWAEASSTHFAQNA